MIDIHEHILPGMDDGPSTQEEALGMARAAVANGIRIVVATPHSLNGVYTNWRKEILSACKKFNSALKEHAIALTVLPGSEVRLSPEIIDALESGRLMTLNDAGRHISLELPDQFIPAATISFINRLRGMGITPIISHPERNPSIQHNVELLRDIIAAGALTQITAGSLTGGFGQHAQKCCQKIVELRMVHFMASDAHSMEGRPPLLDTPVKWLTTLTSEAHITKAGLIRRRTGT
ncbi:MAG: CpsB/CapC family capsule biosynthesis tyrosine phosphatase [Thermodesulfobacteriota bacterium]|nr:CpsB/CapC family capsule biosynthesis tyrosine phosphatase [Thermodesulfobacteriota bacterium]